MEILHCRHRRKASKTHKVGGFRLDLVLDKCWTVLILDSLWILGNIFTTSELIKKAFLGILLLLKIYLTFSMSFASLVCDGKFSESFYIFFSTKINQDSTAVLQPLVITLARFFILRVFILSCILPCLECSDVINLTQSLLTQQTFQIRYNVVFRLIWRQRWNSVVYVNVEIYNVE